LAPGKKIIIDKNATAYTWDWYCHLVVDRASLFNATISEIEISLFLSNATGCEIIFWRQLKQ